MNCAISKPCKKSFQCKIIYIKNDEFPFQICKSSISYTSSLCSVISKGPDWIPIYNTIRRMRNIPSKGRRPSFVILSWFHTSKTFAICSRGKWDEKKPPFSIVKMVVFREICRSSPVRLIVGNSWQLAGNNYGISRLRLELMLGCIAYLFEWDFV